MNELTVLNNNCNCEECESGCCGGGGCC